MNAEAWIALVVGGTALLLNVSTLLIGYGVMKGTLSALHARVTALEVEMSALNDLKVTVARIGERQDMWIEQLRELNASIRWMRSPALAETPGER
jgi:hypothetical protein